MFEVSAKSMFSAAHHLKGYPGSCAEPHGHNWEVEVFIRGTELDATGILIDFRLLKETIKDVLKQIDHRDLSALEAFGEQNPTSENISRFIFRGLSAVLDSERYWVDRVSVAETPGNLAAYWEPKEEPRP